jgi:hypothetical protein
LTVSPGPNAGMSSRSDALSTKSSVFIGDSSLLLAALHGLRGYALPNRRIRADLTVFVSAAG